MAAIILDKKQMILQIIDNLLQCGGLRPGEETHFKQIMRQQSIDQVSAALLQSQQELLIHLNRNAAGLRN